MTIPPPYHVAALSFGIGFTGQQQGWPITEILLACCFGTLVLITLHSWMATRRLRGLAVQSRASEKTARVFLRRRRLFDVDYSRAGPPLNKGNRHRIRLRKK